MSVNLHILKASGRLATFEKEIKTAFDKAVRKIVSTLSLPNVDVVVADNPGVAMPETGVGGSAKDKSACWHHVSMADKHSPMVPESFRHSKYSGRLLCIHSRT